MRFPGFEGEWRLINISELLDFQNGINADSDKYGSGIKYISVSDILNNPYICYDDIKGLVDIDHSTLGHYKVEYGDIIFQRSSETFEDIGHANVYLDKSRPATFGGFVIRGRKKGNYNPFFFKNLLDTPYARKATTRMGAGAQHYNIGQDGLSKIALYFPKINEQEKIADLFMILNKKIQLQKKLIETLKLYKRGLLAKLFPQNGENQPELRLDGFTGYWSQHKLGEVCQITMGQSPDGSTYSDTPSDYILIQGNADLKDGWVTPRVWTTQKTKIASAGDLIMSVRAPAGTMGKTAYNAVIGRGVAAIKGNEFLYQLLIKMDKTGYWKKLSCGSTFESLNSNNIFNAEILTPEIVEQEKIGKFLLNLDNLIILQQHNLEEFESIKEGLLQQIFI